MPILGPGIPEAEIAAYVDAATHSEAGRAALLALLPEESPLYAGRGTNQTRRIRGYVLAAFERVGLPEEALPYVMEELESGDEAYLVAAAARGLRGFAGSAAGAAPYLVSAVGNIRYYDETLSFEGYLPPRPLPQPTTAVAEILKTLAWLGSDAACIRTEVEGWAGGAARLPSALQPRVAEVLRTIGRVEHPDTDCCWSPPLPKPVRGAAALTAVRLEDQDGAHLRWGDFFSGKPSVVAFFYTRCSNPNKCSLTVARLSALQKELDGRGLAGRVRIAAITYDPMYDLPHRLHAFGLNRGAVFGEDFRFFRAPEDHDRIRMQLALGVNYADSVVTRHRIELFVLDERGEVTAVYIRMQWEVEAVAPGLEMLLRRGASPISGVLAAAGRATAALPALALAVLPKCPMCWAAYLAAVGAGSLHNVFSRSVIVPLLLALLGVHAALVVRRALRTGRRAGMLLSGAGLLAVLAGSVLGEIPALSYAGGALLVLAAILGSRAPSLAPGAT
jgi:protein SCO1/2